MSVISLPGKAWLGALAAVTASVGLFGADSASAAEVVDAHCGNTTPPAGSSFPGIPRVGQTFTALNTGQLISATVSVNKSGLPSPPQPDAAFSIQIRPLDMSGAPDESAALATESVPAPALGGFQPLTANFSSPASVVAGEQYALVVERTGNSFGVGIESTAVACEGDMWVTTPTPAWAKSCTENPPMPPVCTDLAFAIRVNAVEPPPTPPIVQPTPAASTGQRAAALKKCKKKRKKQARKKCKKKAKRLPF